MVRMSGGKWHKSIPSYNRINTGRKIEIDISSCHTYFVVSATPFMGLLSLLVQRINREDSYEDEISMFLHLLSLSVTLVVELTLSDKRFESNS